MFGEPGRDGLLTSGLWRTPKKKGPGRRASSPSGPAVMAPQRGPLLLLALSLGLAGAQKNLDDVPVQPGFNAHEVTEPGQGPGTVLGRGGRCPWGLGTTARQPPGAGPGERGPPRGEGRPGPRHRLAKGQLLLAESAQPRQERRVLTLPLGPGGKRSCLPVPSAQHPALWRAWLERGQHSVCSGASLSPPQTRPGRLEPSRGQRYHQTWEELREAGQGEARRGQRAASQRKPFAKDQLSSPPAHPAGP